jgi:hypothetical protein
LRDKEGNAYSVLYDQVNAMLLNEFLKEHQKVVEQQVTIAELKSTVAESRRNSSPSWHSSKSKLKRLLRAYRK